MRGGNKDDNCNLLLLYTYLTHRQLPCGATCVEYVGGLPVQTTVCSVLAVGTHLVLSVPLQREAPCQQCKWLESSTTAPLDGVQRPTLWTDGAASPHPPDSSYFHDGVV